MEIYERSSLMYWPFKPTLDSSSSLDDNFFQRCILLFSNPLLSINCNGRERRFQRSDILNGFN